MTKETGKCAICKGDYTNFGNNPEPLLPIDKRVCSDCNMQYVLLARLGNKQQLKELKKIIKEIAKNS